MKKIILLVIAAFFAAGAYAQQFECGVKGGLNFAVETNGQDDTGTRVGFVGGVFIEFPLSENLGLQPELVYSMQGAYSEGGNLSATDKLDYINLPVMLKFYVWEHRFSIDAGLQLGYMVSARVTYRSAGNSATSDILDKIDNRFDIALGLGVSFRFSQRFDAGFRYNLGMIKMIDRLDNRNAVTQLTLGYRF